MTIRTQKILLFIPIINIAIFFYWIYSLHSSIKPIKRIVGVFWRSAICCIILFVFDIIINEQLDNTFIIELINYVTSYLFCLSISYISLRDQIKYNNDKPT